MALAPAAICRRHEVLPIAISEEYLVLAMVDPGNIFALDDIRAATGRQVRVVVAERSDLQGALDRFHRPDGELSSLNNQLEQEAVFTGIRPLNRPLNRLRTTHLSSVL